MNLPLYLSHFEALELCRRADADDSIYIFKNALTQEAAYQLLLLRRRREVHWHVAQAYEQLYPDHLDEYAPLLAEHYAEAADDAKTLEYSVRAGRTALALYANKEAILHFSRAIQVARKSDQAALVRDLYVQRGRALEMSGRYEEARQNYEEAESLAIDRGDRGMQLAALVALATIHSTPTALFDVAHGRTLSQLALGLAREVHDRPSEARVLWNLMLLSNFSGELRQAVTYGEQSLAISRELGMPEQIAYTSNDLFRPYVSTGQYERAREVAEETREFWRASGNQTMLADNLARTARILFALGEFERALVMAAEAREISHAIGNLWGQSFCRMFIAYIFLERGEIAQTIETMEECIRFADASGFMMAQIATRADLGRLYATLGAFDRGVHLARAAYTRAEERLPSFKPWVLASLTRLHVIKGEVSKAQEYLREGYACLGSDLAQHAYIEMPLADAELALVEKDYSRTIRVMDELFERLGQVGMRPFRADALYLKGKAHLGRAEINAAWENLVRARVEAQSLGSTRIEWKILDALSAVEHARGKTEEAEIVQAQSRAMLGQIVQTVPSELRDSFRALNLPVGKRQG